MRRRGLRATLAPAARTTRSAAWLTLEAFRNRELPLRVRKPAGLLKELGKEIVGGAVIRIVLNGASQHPFRCGRLPFLHVRPAEHDIRRAVKRIEPDGF